MPTTLLRDPPPDSQTFVQPFYDDDVHSAAVAATIAVDATPDVVRPVFTLPLGKVFNVEQNGKKLPYLKWDMFVCLILDENTFAVLHNHMGLAQKFLLP